MATTFSGSKRRQSLRKSIELMEDGVSHIQMRSRTPWAAIEVLGGVVAAVLENTSKG